MIDIARELIAIHRDVRRRDDGVGEAVAVVLRRSCDAPIADVWDA